MSTKERIELRVEKGALVPATPRAASILRTRGLRLGDIVTAEIRKERNPRFNRLAHSIGGLCAQNIDAFDRMDAHAVLKRLQLESGLCCDEQIADLPGIGQAVIRVPQSISFGKMDETQFNALIAGLCAWVSQRYWPMLTPEQVRDMAEAWVE